MNKDYYAILMAGGVGSRFWPVSTTEFPKQFHDMLGSGETLIQKTFSRLAKLIPAENILILTNESYNHLVLEQLPMVKQEQVLLEPAMRNTAPCILYASLKIQKANPNAVMVVAPSDHWIEDETSFARNLQECFDFCAKENALMTLGIQPTFPNTGFGYIEYDKTDANPIKKVNQFREKPDYETAKLFLDSGNFLWNGGIFIWSVKTITEAFSVFQPKMNDLFLQGLESYNTPAEKQFIEENYALAENISIDYAVMEIAKNVYVLPATFDWNDLGTWGSLHEKLDKDENNNAVVNAKVLLENSSNNIVRSDADKLIVIDGLHDYIIVDKEGILLIYPKSKEQDIKSIVKKLEQN
ncbi:mannose-1-phosphate guanylyltransferase [Flavobacterium psychrophilum]|uniref:mannose-1-phosphate guanylyltransferase n=1 Tax=Flavobacterium psychrophilum (strain ATCC 49511 / DSM 21280 / CIP 103535 / JIP02/86) TaxID=402612 RepID=A6GZE1_FLAPJ|nr:mannose-1-phosphate guanylyltransferase [Flavobacterium psychrophilum]AIG30168.1 mannose-1-phosphate guanylyltransferase [Flavobacterium psychrophilum]AIG32443.1 mannose-1-phosphate guanylyltransferase [Flavobacterium psychrophilum]AIG34602.1 mannose-1-phosphate guanylyltransferase [Flavobacterium psychrophilum]AIG36962.1 mannose-1-phosphate guanylyltransferase [Flavobacterium psychrophilum]AIG39226.1 mannose-1-phosphate guanylyltransferase [Flavobacterium psychrophilum]